MTLNYDDPAAVLPVPKPRPRTWSISPFFNELDVVEVKIREQMRWVDVFVFAEATRTYAGSEKATVLSDAMASGALDGLLADAKAAGSEIRVVVVDDDPVGDDVFQPFGDRARWARENHQRAALIRGMDGLQPDDVVCLSDLDEIVRGALIRGYAEQAWDFITVPPLTMHVASLSHRWWMPIHVIARLFKGEALLPCSHDPTYWTGKHCGLSVEDVRRLPGVRIEVPPGCDMSYYGWHLSYMGGSAAIDYKLREAAHPELDLPQYRSPDHLAAVAGGDADLFSRDGRPTVPCPIGGLPDEIQRDFGGWQRRLEGDVRVHDPV